MRQYSSYGHTASYLPRCVQCNRLPGGAPGFPVLARRAPSRHWTYLPYLIWTVHHRKAAVFVAVRHPRAAEPTTGRRSSPPGPTSSVAPSISGALIMSTTLAYASRTLCQADGEGRASTSSCRRLDCPCPLPKGPFRRRGDVALFGMWRCLQAERCINPSASRHDTCQRDAVFRAHAPRG